MNWPAVAVYGASVLIVGSLAVMAVMWWVA